MKKNIWLWLFVIWGIALNCHWANAVSSLSWERMEDLDYQSGKMSESLNKLNNQMVEVAGFIVPLEMDGYIDTVTEFLLVPNPLACIHIPPPPPNQMIYVTMKEEIPLDMDLRGVEIQGVIRVVKQEDEVFSFELSGISAKEGNIEFEDPYLNELFQ